MLTIEGNIVNIDKTTRGRIEIGDDGLITKVGEPTGVADLILTDELIFPGFIDLHVHARECADHSQDYKEDFTSAGEAAINGGVVAFAEMPNNPTAPITNKSYLEKKKLTEKSAVEIVLYAATNATSEPLTLNVPYKVYISKSVGDLFFDSFEELEIVISKYSDKYVVFHCEDPKVLRENEQRPTHEQRRPARAEISAVEFALEMIEKYNLQGRVCHISTKEAAEKVVAAKARGIKVTAEIAPHHLYFDEEVIASAAEAILSREKIASSDVIKISQREALLALTKMFQVNPPIRQTKENRLALIAALKNGEIDYLATDHAPHTIEEKEKGMSGLTHLDTYGSFATWLMKEHGFTAQDIIRICSYNPANFLSSFTDKKYGKIAEGFVGCLTVIDTGHSSVVDKTKLKTKARWSPFEGVTFPGAPIYTIIKGKLNKTLW